MKDTIQREAKPWAEAKAETFWCFPPFVQNDSNFSVVQFVLEQACCARHRQILFLEMKAAQPLI